MSHLSIDYRRDIDGLRGVAVLGVVLGHAGLGLPGGFVGVDVFFVISGFLITSLIMKELAAGTFSLSGFWARRVRRILPAALLMIACVLIAGTFILIPRDLEGLGRSAVAQLLFVSNVYFWLDQNYFGVAANLKPLLHTWSLGVEEQFYLFFPLLLAGLYGFARQWLGWALLACLVISLGLCVYASYYHSSAGFYLLPTRLWELMAGCLIALTVLRFRTFEAPGWLAEIVMLGAGLLIVMPMLFYSEATRFPGITAVPPVLGATLVILVGCYRKTLVGRLLASSPLVGIGLISYSLYLWHWPILALLRYLTGANFDALMGLAAILAATGVSLFSWRWVERPFRSLRGHPVRSFLSGGVFAAIMTLMSISVISVSDASWRLPLKIRTALNELEAGTPDTTFQADLDDIQAGRVPGLGQSSNKPVFLLWGDSHATVVAKLLDDLAKMAGLSGLSVAKSQTGAIVASSRDGHLQARKDAILNLVEAKQLRHVILFGRWSGYYSSLSNPSVYLDSVARQSRASDLDHTIDRLLALGCVVHLVKEVPAHRGGAAFLPWLLNSIAYPEAGGIEQTNRNDYESQSYASNGYLAEQAARSDVFLYEINDAVFTAAGLLKHEEAGRLLYFDDNHLTHAGVELVYRRVLETILKQVSESAVVSP